MQERNQQASEGAQNRPKSVDQPGHGPQGVDKAPGEEPSEDNVQFTMQTQKGKKVDRDPSNPSDEPLENQDI